MEINTLGHTGVTDDHAETASKAGVRASCVPVRTALCRHFDADGALLYVGISLNSVARLAQHKLTAHWFAAIARIEIEWHPTRQSAESAEIVAIQNERPMHNLKHGLPPALIAFLSGHPKAYMVGPDGLLLEKYSSFEESEASQIAKLLD